MAAFLISSKHAIKPKVRIWAFSFYIAVCICFASMGFLLGTWGLVLNQTVLFFINIRGIYNAAKELHDSRACITCKFRENGYLCENDKVVCGDNYKGWKPRTVSNRD